MKRFLNIQLFFLVGFLLTFMSCSPSITYLGDSLRPTRSLDVFYDSKDIEREYTTIGSMSAVTKRSKYIEKYKSEMIAKAKSKGGEGIIFDKLEKSANTVGNVSNLTEVIIHLNADVIVYKD